MKVIQKYALSEKMPVHVLKLIEKGTEGEIPETPKKGEKVFDNVDNVIVGSNRIALEAAKDKAESLGMSAEILSSEFSGEAREAGLRLAKKALEVRKSSPNKKFCLISGGETTVTVKGAGKGGRNTELALAAAIALEGEKGITILSAGTDGNDGPTDAAGAIVDGESIDKARKLGLKAEEYLDNNDSYTFFKKTGDILITGPTGTNVMDVQIVLVQ
jgi:glycerate-2-kinase